MNPIERIAIFTMIENIEHQLKGLKTLLAAGNSLGNPAQHKTTKVPIDHSDSIYASDEDEAQMKKEIEAQTEKLRKDAEVAFSTSWALTQEQING